MNWLPRSRTSARESEKRAVWHRNRLRTACVVQAPVGFAVIPAKNTHRRRLWSGVNALVLEDSPDGGCSDGVAETVQCSCDAAVSPGRVLGRHIDNELVNFGSGRWPSGRLDWLGPVPGDASAVPTQEGFGCDEASVAVWSGECLGDGAEQ